MAIGSKKKSTNQKRFQSAFEDYMKSGGNTGNRIFAGFGAVDGGGKKGGGGGPEIEDPPLPPVDGNGGGSGTPEPVKAVPKDWIPIVDHFFPNGGTGYKAGGLVRGGGAALKGRGRGRIV